MRGRVVVIVRLERGAARLGREREEPGGCWAVTRRWHADVLRVWQPSLRPRPGEGVARRGRSGSERGEERRRPLTSMRGSCERGLLGRGLIGRAGAVGGGVCGARRGGWGNWQIGGKQMASSEGWWEGGCAGGWWWLCAVSVGPLGSFPTCFTREFVLN